LLVVTPGLEEAAMLDMKRREFITLSAAARGDLNRDKARSRRSDRRQPGPPPPRWIKNSTSY